MSLKAISLAIAAFVSACGPNCWQDSRPPVVLDDGSVTTGGPEWVGIWTPSNEQCEGDKACPLRPGHAYSYCISGSCWYRCGVPARWRDCDGDDTNGCETNVEMSGGVCPCK